MNLETAAIVAAGYFKHYPSLSELFVTTDSQVFEQKHFAQGHAEFLDVKDPKVFTVSKVLAMGAEIIGENKSKKVKAASVDSDKSNAVSGEGDSINAANDGGNASSKADPDDSSKQTAAAPSAQKTATVPKTAAPKKVAPEKTAPKNTAPKKTAGEGK